MPNLQRLNRAFDRIGTANNLDELIKQSILALRYDLGFDRAAYLEFDEKAKRQLGTWGTDASGALRDEHGFSDAVKARHTDICEKDPILLTEPASLHDLGEVVGIGWHIQSAVTSNDQILGWLYIDNLTHHRPLTDSELNQIRIFSNVFSQLIARNKAEQLLNKALNSLECHKTETEIANHQIQQLQAKLTGSQKMASLAEQMIGLIPISSRSVGNVLNFMSLLSPEQFHETDRPMLESARKSANRLARIFRHFDDKIHQATDNDSQTMPSLMVKHYWKDLFSEYFSETPHKLNVHIECESETITLPMVLLTLMLKELVSNALLHGLENSEAGEVSIQLKSAAESTMVIVEDSGWGLDECNYTDALKLFVTSKPNELLGSGLNVTRNYVERWLNGQLTLDKSPLGGLRCTLTIPTQQ
ncbi:ATP-binding protein [Reinekea marinisedimentorum]|uniref:histidine kinase n=1 Tax=Reinekea marinisedimentorum TaxID=230495 RepID=A0A4R3HWK0_9GAMM|nr:ATP-binding protein [Reinekea marinisedimentorum]TCS37667.1 signal transduction histidine kinase [Reinekea marinisedimentorum]